MFYLTDLKKASDGLAINQTLIVEDQLRQREPAILGISPIKVAGRISHDNGLFFLTYTMTYELTLPSSRSLAPVTLTKQQDINEVFIDQADQAGQQELVEDDLVLLVEDGVIDLTDSVLDNILLDLPSRVLTPEEEASQDLPSGTDWTLLTESQYQEQQAEQKAANSPFAGLSGLFDNETDED